MECYDDGSIRFKAVLNVRSPRTGASAATGQIKQIPFNRKRLHGKC